LVGSSSQTIFNAARLFYGRHILSATIAIPPAGKKKREEKALSGLDDLHDAWDLLRVPWVVGDDLAAHHARPCDDCVLLSWQTEGSSHCDIKGVDTIDAVISDVTGLRGVL
jgi:hypothetical protein